VDAKLNSINDGDESTDNIQEEEEEDQDTEMVNEGGQDNGNATLFANHYFWISREVPLYLTKFIIRACGGTVGWTELAGPGSPIKENDSRITIVITDRPAVIDPVQGREYLQPQWIYDCINANKLVKTSGYHPGEALPPHLSPFVVAGEDDYSPHEVEVNFTNERIQTQTRLS
jgi:pescadillo protein